MIELVSISKTFNAGKPGRFRALEHIDLRLANGQVTVFTGPSGSGKTTMLSIIGCMVRPTSGRIRIRGRDVTTLPERFLSQIRRDCFGFVFQNFNLIRGVTALETVMLPAYPTNRSPRQVRGKALRLLEELDIPSRAHEPVQHLSGGEQQRTAIARALINDPEFIIADEPTAHLDTDLARQFLGIIARLRSGGRTVLIGSHDPLVTDSGVVDRVVELRYGSVAAGGEVPC
jgi:putative ABC transport system ATP-binding protein